LFTLSFVEYIPARSPVKKDECDTIKSPPEKNIFVNENEKWEETLDPNYNKSSNSVHQERHFTVNLNYPFVPSSGAHKSILNFDLNQTPPSEDE